MMDSETARIHGAGKRGQTSQGVVLPLHGCEVRLFSGSDLILTYEPFFWTRTHTDEPTTWTSSSARRRQRWWWRVAEWLTDPPSVTLEGRRRRRTQTRREKRYARLVSDHKIETSLALISNNDRTRPDERDKRRARLDCAGLDDLRRRCIFSWARTRTTSLVLTCGRMAPRMHLQ